MGSKSPVFPMPPHHHFSDYGFDPQLDYFQVLEEARRHGKRSEPRPPEPPRFKLQKPISKDDHRAKSKKRRWPYWWKSAALLFWKREKPQPPRAHSPYPYPHRSVSGPIYVADYSGPAAPCRTSRPASGPLRFTEAGDAAAGVPYVSLRDLNLVEGHRASASDPPPLPPIYLVT